MNDERQETLLPGGKEVSFSQIEAALAGLARDRDTRTQFPPRSSTATVVVVGACAQLSPAVAALAELGKASGVRAILISEGTQTTPVVRMTDAIITIDGLAPRYLNNAVAALRLPCLPALVWWRGGSLQALEGLTTLADRLVLDSENPDEVWQHVEPFLEQTALTDLRWTRLTKWRAMLAHLFDLPQVRAAIPGFRRVLIQAHDRPSGRLFAAWLVSNLRWSEVQIEVQSVTTDGRSALESVQLIGDRLSIAIRILPSRHCLEASVDGEEAHVRIAPLGELTLSACIGEELAVRSRDLAFERALVALRKLAA